MKVVIAVLCVCCLFFVSACGQKNVTSSQFQDRLAAYQADLEQCQSDKKALTKQVATQQNALQVAGENLSESEAEILRLKEIQQQYLGLIVKLDSEPSERNSHAGSQELIQNLQSKVIAFNKNLVNKQKANDKLLIMLLQAVAVYIENLHKKLDMYDISTSDEIVERLTYVIDTYKVSVGAEDD